MEAYNDSQKELKELRKTKERYNKNKIFTYAFANVATVSILLLISYYVFLGLEDKTLFIKMLTESLMWIPIAVGIAITAMVGLLPKVIKKLFNKKD
jgi:hypothetical protein